MQEGVLVLKSGEVFEGWLHGTGGSSQGAGQRDLGL